MALQLRRKVHESVVFIDRDSAPRIISSGMDFIPEDLPVGTRVIYPNAPVKGLPNREAGSAARWPSQSRASTIRMIGAACSPSGVETNTAFTSGRSISSKLFVECTSAPARPLSAEQQSGYLRQWRAVQTRFVDDPRRRVIVRGQTNQLFAFFLRRADCGRDRRSAASAQLHRAFGPRVDPGSASGLREGIPMWIPRDAVEGHSDGNQSTL